MLALILSGLALVIGLAALVLALANTDWPPDRSGQPRAANDAAAAPPYKIPGPYEIALLYGAALVASGKYDNVGAAMGAAWAAVPEFFVGRDLFTQQIGPMYFGMESAAAQAAAGQAAANQGGKTDAA